MSKRKFPYDNEADYYSVPGGEAEYVIIDKFCDDKKHSLDSDEEEITNESKYDIMHDSDIQGQENKTIEYDGEIQITPFNMQEELEEGHFDQEGFYHWDRDNNEIRDNWLENIDWIKVKAQEEISMPIKEESDHSEDVPDSEDYQNTLKQMLELMIPGETVAKALRRLGPGGSKHLSASERWKRKKKGEVIKEDTCTQDIIRLTGLADHILNSIGDMDIYQQTYEQLQLKVKQLSNNLNISNVTSINVSAELENCKMPSANQTPFEKHKLHESDNADTFGPCSSEAIFEYIRNGKFTNGGWVRHFGIEKTWHSVSELLTSIELLS